MSFADLRRILFQVHMWIGLALGILLALLGLSGSLLVYDDAIANLIAPPPAATAEGAPLPLDTVIHAARAAGGPGEVRIALPVRAGEAVAVRIGNLSRMGGTRRGLEVFVDPASGKVLGTRKALLPPLLIFAHQLHGNFLMGRDGRRFVGWLGIAMLALGLSGLVLWWPRRGQWKHAFFVRRTAQGLRFHRELHAAAGIWAFAVFMVVSFSGVMLAWPQDANALLAPDAAPTAGMRSGPHVDPVKNGRRIGADAALAIARAAAPGFAPQAIMLPARPSQAIAVNLADGDGLMATAYIDPYRARLMTLRRPQAGSPLAWMRPLHQGSAFGGGVGAVWRFLVFLIGLLPTLFVVTGITMWIKKRRRRIAMNLPLAQEEAA